MPSPLPDADLKQDGSIEPPADPLTTRHRSYLQNLLSALQLVRSGDFSIRMPGDSVGIDGKIADTFNEIIAANQQMAKQLELVGQVVGREGKTRKRLVMGLPHGAWREMEESIGTSGSSLRRVRAFRCNPGSFARFIALRRKRAA